MHCQRGTTSGDPAWADPALGKDLLWDFLVAEQALDIEADLLTLAPAAPVISIVPAIPAWVPAVPSHPGGLGVWLPTVGTLRTHWGMKAYGALVADPLPPPMPDFIGKTLFRICDLTSMDVGWRGLALDARPIMVSCSIAGAESTATPATHIMEGFELCQPFRSFTCDAALLAGIMPVASPDAAWTMFRADDTKRLFLSTSEPPVDLDGHLPWSGNAVDE